MPPIFSDFIARHIYQGYFLSPCKMSDLSESLNGQKHQWGAPPFLYAGVVELVGPMDLGDMTLVIFLRRFTYCK